MFLHLSVSHSVHRGTRARQGVCMAGGYVWQGACMAGGMCGGGMHGGNVCGRGCAWQGGLYAMHAPHPTLRDMVGQCKGGTHPTGMHSCFSFFQN